MNHRQMKRWACALLSLLLTLSSLTGCQADTPDPSETTAPPATEATTPPATQPTEYIGLTLESPLESQILTFDPTLTIRGSSDPAHPVTVNGQPVPQDEDGHFSYDAPLSLGLNQITVAHKEEEAQYTVERRYAVQFFFPAENAAYHNGQTVYIRLAVREGSDLSVTFRDTEIEMTETVDQLGSGAMEGFALYTGSYVLPSDNDADLELGPIQYRVTCDGETEVFSSAPITCSAKAAVTSSDPDATPAGGSYCDVGSGYIVEVVDGSVETFNGKTNDDYSNPTYNYLPQGTVDYGSQNLITDPTGQRYYRLLRCGVRVYDRVKNVPILIPSQAVDCYTGTLPDHNEIGIASLEVSGHHTLLTLDTLWKAPFFFDFEEQDYTDTSIRDYSVERFDAGFVDITFCYATQVTGSLQIPADNPLFRSAELIQNESDYTLRLHLKKPGGFYGWDAFYLENGQLCFRFLNPVTVTRADNAYGADLTGVRIMIDVGHGGTDVGAAWVDSRDTAWMESLRNLELSFALKKELESLGATVLMNRTTEEEVTTQRERNQYLRQQAPDYCIAIHHNSDTTDLQRNGFEAGYFSTFSQLATDHIHYATRDARLYRSSLVMWHFYYVARQSCCPVVLTENGYMTNLEDLEESIDPRIIQQKAAALTQGIVNYFLEISQ